MRPLSGVNGSRTMVSPTAATTEPLSRRAMAVTGPGNCCAATRLSLPGRRPTRPRGEPFLATSCHSDNSPLWSPVASSSRPAGFEQDLLLAWWAEAARTDPGVPSPEARTLARTPKSVQAALNALSGSAFFTGMAERMMVSSLRQVRRYLTEPALRQEVTARVLAAIGPDTAVVVGHSLGSVVAYEALCAAGTPVRSLVTLGSPLGIRNLVFDRLEPAPGGWPGQVSAWTNVADDGDVVALVKDLRPLFGERVRTVLVHNGSRAHDMSRYLTTAAVGQAIAEGLDEAV